MPDSSILQRLIKDCEFYFGDSLISKEQIIRDYADFLVTSTLNHERSSKSIALHTGSMCFDIVALIMAMGIGIYLDETTPDSIIGSLKVEDLVLFERNGQKKRCRWYGIEDRFGYRYMKLVQDGSGQDGPLTDWLPLDQHKHKIEPYYGASQQTDGRGIHQNRADRADFISFITGKNNVDIPSFAGVSVVIVADKALFDRIQKEVTIKYNGKQINLLDVVTASYYSDGGETHQFGRNPSRAEPVLKITRKISVARDLVLQRHGNKVVGLVVLSPEAAAKGDSELEDLLRLESLRFKHISIGIDLNIGDKFVSEGRAFNIFACTKELLSKYSISPNVENNLTFELYNQIENIKNYAITKKVIDGVCTRERYEEIRKALYVLKQSEWDDYKKKKFIMTAYSLFNLFTTSIFSMESLESFIKNDGLHFGVISPAVKLSELREIAENSKSFNKQCDFVVNTLNDLYRSVLSDSPKALALEELVKDDTKNNIAIVVPKAYYIHVLRKESSFLKNNISIMTANRFDVDRNFARVIVVGDFSGTRFDPLKYKSSAQIIILLYDFEAYFFEHKINEAYKFERTLNLRMGLISPASDSIDGKVESTERISESAGKEFSDLENYINTIAVSDISEFVGIVSDSDGASKMSEITAIGRFLGGEQILFSKYYRPVVYDPSNKNESITEIGVDRLNIGDRLVFMKRDDFTKNTVDNLLDVLRDSGKLGGDILDALEKAGRWKECLREYQNRSSLSYGELERRMNDLGSTIKEQTIRQWLMPDGYIVGPREKTTLRQIGEMTGDSDLSRDASGYFNACKIVRKQRKRILGLIGKAIESKLSGRYPKHGSELEIVYDNVEKLSETLELEALSFFEESLSAPDSFINKPIKDVKVIV